MWRRLGYLWAVLVLLVALALIAGALVLAGEAGATGLPAATCAVTSAGPQPGRSRPGAHSAPAESLAAFCHSKNPQIHAPRHTASDHAHGAAPSASDPSQQVCTSLYQGAIDRGAFLVRSPPTS
jgi:hypothetical protein